MINAEKFKDEILEHTCKNETFALLRKNDKIVGCYRTACNKCVFYDDGCSYKKLFDWLLSEYKEPIELTKFEYDFLNDLNIPWEWIARNENGDLFIYSKNPKKGYIEWSCDEDFKQINNLFRNKHFEFIKWKDEKPYLIDYILKNCEVIEDEDND